MVNNGVQVASFVGGPLYLTPEDGRSAAFDVKPFMKSDFFSALKSAEYFSQVGLFYGGVVWLGGQDFGPDTIEAFLSVTESVSA